MVHPVTGKFCCYQARSLTRGVRSECPADTVKSDYPEACRGIKCGFLRGNSTGGDIAADGGELRSRYLPAYELVLKPPKGIQHEFGNNPNDIALGIASRRGVSLTA